MGLRGYIEQNRLGNTGLDVLTQITNMEILSPWASTIPKILTAPAAPVDYGPDFVRPLQ